MIINHGNEEYEIFFDGELYNHDFTGQTDEETVLNLYIEYKEKALNKLNGVFALAIHEKNSGKIFCARDRIGVKPLFYTIKNGGFIFAPDIKTLLEKSQIQAEIDEQSIAEILLIGPGRTPGYAVFKNISELEPATWGIFENGGFKKYKYWDLTDGEHTDNFEQTAEKVRYLVVDSMKRQFILDKNKKICTFLSGGLDSSLITAVAAKYFKEHGQKLNAFSVDYQDNAKYFNASRFQPDSDGEYIEYMKNYLKSEYFEHHQIILDIKNLVNALYEAVDARDLPGMADVDASLLLFCREVKKFADIALSGESADEIFGGYPWYKDKEIRERDGFPWSQSTDFRKTFFKKDFQNANNYVSGRYLRAVSESDVSKTNSNDEKRIKELVNLNIKWFMQTLLERQNRMSAHSNLIIRAPYCDYRIVEYLYNVPWEYKDYNGTEKGLLRSAMRDLLPEKVLWRRKSPYPKTHNPEYLNAVSEILLEIINEPSSPLLKIINKNSLENLLKSNATIPWYGQLMTTPQTIAYFIQINYWLEKYKINIV